MAFFGITPPFLNSAHTKRPDKNHRSGAFPLLLRHYGVHSLRETRTMTSFQLRWNSPPMSEKQYSKVYFLCQALLCITLPQSVKHKKREHPLRMRRAFSFLSKGGVTIPTSPNNGRRLPVPSSVAHLYPLLLYHRNSKCQHAITRQYFFKFPLSIKLRTRFGFNL